jgi:uncharacterized phage-associated protein
MIKSHAREKLINAAVFFAQNTNYCGKIKLIKLLYLLDFEHFRQTGHSVTGLDYFALQMGPVPLDFFQEWESFGPDLSEAIEIAPEKVFDYTRLKVVAKRAFDDSHFTKRELRIMGDLAAKLRDDLSQSLIDLTHTELGPWMKVWDNGRGNREHISYSLAIDDNDPNGKAVLEAATDHHCIVAAVGLTH